LEKGLRVLQAEICRDVEIKKERSEDFQRAVSGRVMVSMRIERLGGEHDSTSLARFYIFWSMANRI
jgi:hypothetical protein